MTNTATAFPTNATDDDDLRIIPGWLPLAKATAQAMQVNPQLAKHWLDKSAANRPLRPDRVAFFARLMTAGEFIFTGEPVMFSGSLASDTAMMMNGQHRLHGICTSGRTVPLMVVDSVPKEAMLYLDTGARRSFADNLAILGYKNSTTIAAVVRLAFIMASPTQRKDLTTGGGASAVSHAELMRYFELHEATIMASIPFGRSVRAQFSASNAAMSVVWMLLTELDPPAADDFFNRLLKGGPTGRLAEVGVKTPKQPMLALRRWLTNNLIHGNGNTRPRATMQMAVVIKAWNAEQRGDLIQTLVWKMSLEDFPDPIVLRG